MGRGHEFSGGSLMVEILTLESLRRIAVVGIALLPSALILRAIYNFFFHPLAKFPGPKLAAITDLWYSKASLSGNQIRIFQEAHKKYGPVFRYGPNELSFSDPAAWKDIYGHHSHAQTFIKGGFYSTEGSHEFSLTHIVSIKDINEHAAVRRLLSHAFSAKALNEQIPLIDGYVDLFINKVGKRYVVNSKLRGGKGPDGEWCNLVLWFNMTTFDIIGDLSFGDSEAFASLENEKPHEWVSSILRAVRLGAYAEVLRRFTGLSKIMSWLSPKELVDSFHMIFGYCDMMVRKRIAADTDRKDFFSYILDKKDVYDMPSRDMVGNANILTIAGSETTATTLSGIFYYLDRCPEIYDILKKEVRSAFNEYSEINALAVSHLTYLNAVIDEGLRIYPPVPIGLPRVSPGAMVAGHYIPKGVDVSVHAYTVTHDEKNFKDAEKFVPERWIDQKYKETDRKEASQPFSTGPRVCLGRNLAYLELRLIIAKFVYMYDVELVDKEMVWSEANKSYTLWWKPSLDARISFREGLPEQDRVRVENAK